MTRLIYIINSCSGSSSSNIKSRVEIVAVVIEVTIGAIIIEVVVIVVRVRA